MLSHKQAAHANPPMWMVDYNDQVKEISYDAAHNRKRFRRLIPKPSHEGAPCSMVAASSYCSSFYNTDAFSWNSKLANESKLQRGKVDNTEPLVSSRWNPAPEQVMALQEMYERGVRTPSADEIQLIAAKLRQFGKIEGKNVFYWFQNHKARERQKRRRQPDSSPLKHANDMQVPDTKLDLGSRWNILDAQEKMNSTSSLNCNNLLKSSSSMHTAVETESRTNGWTRLDERENQLQKNIHTTITKTSSPLVELSFTPSHLNSNSKTCISEALCSGQKEQSSAVSLYISSLPKDEVLIKLDLKRRKNQMLQLFPLRDDDPWRPRSSEEEEKVATTMAAKFAPTKFYKFL